MQWIKRWNIFISPEPTLPGVWKRRDGGCLVRGHAKDPRTGKLVEIFKVLEDATPKQSMAWLEIEKEKIRNAGRQAEEPQASPTPFHVFAAQLFERKCQNGDIRSASGREKWAWSLGHIFKAPFAEMYVGKVRYANIVTWRDVLPTLIWTRTKTEKLADGTVVEKVVKTGHYSPSALNSWLRVLRTICAAMEREFELPRNPCEGIKLFDEHNPFSEDEPNALNEDGEIGEFLAFFSRMYPQHFEMVALGFSIGHRASTLRPITRKGADPDLSFNADGTARLRIRRSNSRGQAVLEAGTKKLRNGITIILDKDIADMLKAHIARLEADPVTRRSELLFPSSVTGGIQSRSALDKPFAAVAKAMGLKKKITPKAMRRSFKDIARAAGIPGVVRKEVSGHTTDAVDLLYASPTAAEKTQAVAKVFSIATARVKKLSAG